MASCPQCKDLRYLVGRNGERAEARVCTCNQSCTVCGGSGQVFVEQQGYSFVRVCSCRSVAQRAGLFNRANIPARAASFTLESFTPRCQEQQRALELAEAAALRYRADTPSKGFIVSGPVGTGKTHLLCAALRYLTLEQAVPARYVEISFLFSEIKRGFDAGRSGLESVMPLVQVPVLAIDEIGKGRGSPFEMDTLDELVARRYNAGRTTLFATNLGLAGELGAASPDGMYDPAKREEQRPRLLLSRVGDRIYSRLFEMCHAVEFPASLPDHRKDGQASLGSR